MARITRRVLFLLLTVTIVSALVRCSKSDEIDDPNPNTAYLTLTQELPLPFSPKGGKAMFYFSTNESWSIEIETSDDAGNVRASSADRTSGSKTELSGTGATQENSTYAEAASSRTLSTTDDTSASTLSGDAKKWYYVTPLSGDAGDKIAVTVRVDPNEEYTGRSFTLVLRSESLEKRIEVTQLKKNAIIADDNRREISDDEQTLTVKIKANVSYTVQIKQGDEWIRRTTGSRAGGLTEEQYSFAISANTKDEPRTGIVVFQDVDSDLSDEITIVQAEWDDPDPERSALTAIYKAAAGDSWTHNDNWCSQKPLAEWYGVETDADGHVTALRLPKNNLAGTISAKISKLTKLKHLDLSWNALEGPISDTDGKAHVISDFDDLIEAETIDLSHNRLTGQYMPIDGHKSLQLKTLNLSFNQIRGNMFPLNWYCMFENGRTVDLILNNNYLYGDAPDAFQNHPDWGRLALQFIRQYLDHGGIDYTKDIIFPDFTFTDLRDGSKRSIRDLYSSNTMTMIFAWDPTQEDSKTFMETTVRRFHTLYGGQGFAVVAITPEGDQYRTAAEKYLQSHDVPYPVVTDYADAQGRRTVLPAEPYPSYFLVDQTGKVSNDTFTGQRCESFSPDEPYTLDLVERTFQHINYLNIIFRKKLGNSKYQGTDFSMDKKYELLQRATKGKGINIVLIGEAYTDVDIATGYYKQVIEFAMESFFAIEPTKSYREYFNIYMVYAVSRNAYIDQSSSVKTALGVEPKDKDWFYINTATYYLPRYYEVLGISGIPVVGVVINDIYGGVTTLNYYGIRPNYAFTGFYPGSRSAFRDTFLHETVGHGFGYLDDEYTKFSNTTISDSEKSDLRAAQRNGWFLNVSLTDDPKSVNWAHLIGHPNYPYVGVFSGGHYYSTGVWRSEAQSIMYYNTQDCYFNAISRELIVKRIMELAGEEYTFEKFMAKDINGRSQKSSTYSPQQIQEYERHHQPPIIMR